MGSIILIHSTLLLTLCLPSAIAIELDISSVDSIKSAASTIAYGMMKFYTGNNTGDVPGNLPDPYYWWEAGAMFGVMVEYWAMTGDTTYNDVTTQAILHQIGDDEDFMPANQTHSEGNDDQVFWAFTVMSAAEYKYPDPEGDYPSWLALAQAVFNEQASRWDTKNCNGGLRWQIFQFNDGYNYKNTISNGGFFQLAARLARYTGNDTYAQWAEKVWNWESDSVLMDTSTYKIYDGTTVQQNCTEADHLQWTYNYGTWIAGLAYLYNYTSDAQWLTRLDGFLNTTFGTFFPSTMGPNIMVEVACESLGTCDTDQASFKAHLSRWLAVAAQLAPAQYEEIFTRLRVSAQGAAGQCSGSGHTAGTTCGREWNSTVWDGTMGVGEQMCALAVVQSMIIDRGEAPVPITSNTGGTSKSNPSAGTSNSGSSATVLDLITTGDKAGAAILTMGLVAGTVGAAFWMLTGDQ